MLLINGKFQKKIITLALLAVFLADPMTGICYAAEILPDNSVQEFSITAQTLESNLAQTPMVMDDLSFDTKLPDGNLYAAMEDYANSEETQLDIDNEKLALTQQQALNLSPAADITKAEKETGKTTMTNNHDESVIKSGMDVQQKKQALQNLMEKYGYDKFDIKDAMECIDWQKRKTTDFAPTFYIILKNGSLIYFNGYKNKFLYQYAFDEQVMKNISALIDEMKKCGYDKNYIKDALKCIDWQKRKTTDFAPTFYTILKNGNLIYFHDYNAKLLYEYIFDEQVMKNVSVFINEMKKYGYDRYYISHSLEYIDWQKRKTTDFAPTFHAILKNGSLVYFYGYNTQLLYEYIFDEQVMKNIFVFIDEMKKYSYDEDDIKEALEYIDWEKSKNDFEQIINITKLNCNSLKVLCYMNYDKPAATYEILKVMKNNKICLEEDNMRYVFKESSNRIYTEYEKIYKDGTITNKEEKLVKVIKSMENTNKNLAKFDKIKNGTVKTLGITALVITAPIWGPFALWVLWDLEHNN